MTEPREIEFISTDWMERAVCCPGLQVYSRPIRVPVDVPCPQRRKNDAGIPTLSINKIERLIQAAFSEEPFESIDLEDY